MYIHTTNRAHRLRSMYRINVRDTQTSARERERDREGAMTETGIMRHALLTHSSCRVYGIFSYILSIYIWC